MQTLYSLALKQTKHIITQTFPNAKSKSKVKMCDVIKYKDWSFSRDNEQVKMIQMR